VAQNQLVRQESWRGCPEERHRDRQDCSGRLRLEGG
jgi:hypothetical protein